jgi:hypothetical protein
MKINVVSFEEAAPVIEEKRKPEFRAALADAPQSDTNPPAVSAFQDLKKAVQDDAGYAIAWQANLAMPIMDAIKCSHEDANIAGDALMKHIFDIDADEEQVLALESRYVMLNELRTAWKEDGKLTAVIVQEAYANLPEINITASRLSHPARYTLAMEGIASKVWETMKKFWEQIKGFFGKLVTYVKRVFSGEGAISEQERNALIGVLSGAKQRYDQNHGNLPTKSSPDHDNAFVKRFNQVGNAKGVELMKLGATVIPQVKAYTEQVAQYINAMKAWFDATQKGEEKPLPAELHTIMPEFIQQLTKVTELSKVIRNAKEAEGGAKPSLEAAIGLIKNLHVSEGDASKGLHDALDAAQELATNQWVAISKASPDTWIATGDQMGALKGVKGAMHALKNVSIAVLDMRFAEGLVIRLGQLWLEGAAQAYQGASVLSEDRQKAAQYSQESDVFSDLAKKYQGLMKAHH